MHAINPDSLDFGILLIDSQNDIQCFNRWLVEHSGIPAVVAEGTHFCEVLGLSEDSRLAAAVAVKPDKRKWHAQIEDAKLLVGDQRNDGRKGLPARAQVAAPPSAS